MGEHSSRFSGAMAVIEDGIRDGLHIGAQMYVSQHGNPLVDIAVGDAKPGVAMATDTIMLWLSSCKPITAVAIAKMWQEGLLELDDPVAKHIPEFAAKGKQEITIRHLLTHTGGFRWVDYAFDQDWETIIANICEARPEPRWIFGRTSGYHLHSSWFILAEIIQRMDSPHRTFEQYVTNEIFSPLGMNDCYYALSPQQYNQFGDRMGKLATTGGKPIKAIQFDSPELCMAVVPGGSCRGPIRQLGRFYEMLLSRDKLISPQTIEAITARHRTGLYDLTFQHIVDWGLGFIVNSSQYGEQTVPYGFGPHASPRAFGHGGSQSSAGMADPEYGLVVAVVFNGMPGEKAHNRRIRALLKAIYEDLQLSRPSAAAPGEGAESASTSPQNA